MRLRNLFAIGVLSFGVIACPTLSSTVRADDTAKEQPKGEGRSHDPAARLSHYHDTILKLNLTSDQKTKIDAAFADAKTKIDAAVKDANGDHDAIKGKIGPIMKELGATIHSTLTDEQNAELQKQRGARHKDKASDSGEKK